MTGSIEKLNFEVSRMMSEMKPEEISEILIGDAPSVLALRSQQQQQQQQQVRRHSIE